jgi:hypothetical protein
VLDLVATYQVTERLLAAVWMMQGTLSGEFQGGTYFDETKHWSGANLYLSYKFSDVFSLGTRLEYFYNTSGARTIDQRQRHRCAHLYPYGKFLPG